MTEPQTKTESIIRDATHTIANASAHTRAVLRMIVLASFLVGFAAAGSISLVLWLVFGHKS